MNSRPYEPFFADAGLARFISEFNARALPPAHQLGVAVLRASAEEHP